MGKKRFTSKTYLKWLILAGLIAVIGGGAGTFATFNAETTNSGNTFATGTLFLHNTADGTTCTSESVTGNLNTLSPTDCDTLFTVTNPGASEQADLTLKNAGTIDATSLSFDVPSACQDSKPTIATLNGGVTSGGTVGGSITINSGLTQNLSDQTPIEVNDGTNSQDFLVDGDTLSSATSIPVTGATNWAHTFADQTPVQINFGGTGLCGQLKLSIAEMSAGFGSYLGPTQCVYGGTSDSGSGCTSPTTAISSVSSSPIPLGGGLTAGQSRYFRIFVTTPTPNGLTNTSQNSKATFDLLWDITQ